MIHMLEAALISEFHMASGCKNAANSGGEGGLNRKHHLGPPYFVYVTGGRGDQAKWVGWKKSLHGRVCRRSAKELIINKFNATTWFQDRYVIIVILETHPFNQPVGNRHLEFIHASFILGALKLWAWQRDPSHSTAHTELGSWLCCDGLLNFNILTGRSHQEP